MPAEWGTWLSMNVPGCASESDGESPQQPVVSDLDQPHAAQSASSNEVNEVAVAAAADGRLDILQWLLAHSQEQTFEEQVSNAGSPSNLSINSPEIGVSAGGCCGRLASKHSTVAQSSLPGSSF